MARRFLPSGRGLRLGLAVGLVAVASGTLFLVRPSGAASNGGFPFAYVAKFACVPEVGPPSTMFIPQGSPTALQYRTVISVHNPELFPVQITKKAAGGMQEPNVGRIGQPLPLQLVPDQVLAINCADIFFLLGSSPLPNGDGIVEVRSSHSLDVWAVYTMRGTSSGGLNGNIDVVYVPERKVP